MKKLLIAVGCLMFLGGCSSTASQTSPEEVDKEIQRLDKELEHLNRQDLREFRQKVEEIKGYIDNEVYGTYGEVTTLFLPSAETIDKGNDTYEIKGINFDDSVIVKFDKRDILKEVIYKENN
ncbi:hypothetical protein HHO41_19390 [Bacillus sp. DNRA2]|uniref:hypothetical protein n=1 Tax=Bacillus sp. DNRA2 TaxID=2723053 RepID=UPI00145CF168|nr:hypothetical protein [Bacillus sp. DNRA2]NMD72438.1 hypothetical protein [Bacillus sp. DNRA2]